MMSDALAHYVMDAHRCPMCDRRFESRRALFSHIAYTQTHNSMLEELWRLRFLLAEAEKDKEIYREQRDRARDLIKWPSIA